MQISAIHRRGSPLSKEIALVLIIKLCVLTALWYAFFRDPVLPSMIDGMDPEQVSSALLQHPVKEEIQPSEGPGQINIR